MEPNFFIIGAAKSGTTSLYRYLGQHPDVYVSPIKEPCFFSPEAAEYTPESHRSFTADRRALRTYLDGPLTEARGHGIVLEWNEYVKLFKRANKERARGEASVTYLTSASAAAAIRNRIPGARIVALLRNPVDRLYSQFAETLASNHTRLGFADWIEENRTLESRRDPPYGPICTGRYAGQLERYFACFPRDQIRVHLYDDYRSDAAGVVRDVFDFLGVDSAHVVDFERRHNVTAVPKSPRVHQRLVKPLTRLAKPVTPRALASHAKAWWFSGVVPPLTDELRARVLELYRDDIHTLGHLLDRDLSAWLAPTPERRAEA